MDTGIFEFITNESRHSVVVTDESGTIEYANQRAQEVTGYSEKELIGSNPRVIKSGKQSEEFYSQMWQTLQSGDTWNGYFLNKRKDDSLFWEKATIYPFKEKSGETKYIAIKELVTQADHLLSDKFIEFESVNDMEAISKAIDQTSLYKKQNFTAPIEERLARTESLAKIGHWELNHETSVLRWSEEVYRIFELEPRQFNETYESFLENVHPEDREAVTQAYQQSLIDKEKYQINHRLLINGKVKYVSESCYTRFNEKGDPIVSIGAVQDITEAQVSLELQKEYEKKLKFNESKLRLAHEIGRTGIWECEVGTDNFIWSNELFAILGLDPSQKINGLEGFRAFVIKEDLSRVKKAFTNALKTESNGSIDYSIRTTKGEIRHIIDSWRFVSDNTGLKKNLIGVIHDVTSLRASEQKAIKSENQLQSILDSISDKIFIFDENKCFVNFFASSTGDEPYMEPKIFLGKHYTETLPSDMHGIIGKTFDEVLTTGKTKIIEYDIVIEDKIQHYQTAVSKVQGSIPYLTVVARNITVEKLIYDENLKLVHSLKERVKEASCLMSISKLGTDVNQKLESYVMSVCELIPPGFLYPELTEASISIGDQIFQLSPIKYKNKINTPIEVNGKIVGHITVGIPAKNKRGNEIHFLKEEFDLLAAIGDSVSLYLENRDTQLNLEQSEKKYKGIVSNLSEGYIRFDKKGQVLDLNASGEQLLGEIFKSEDFGTDVFEVIPDLRALTSQVKHTNKRSTISLNEHVKIISGRKQHVFRFNLNFYQNSKGFDFAEGTFFDETEKYYLDKLRLANLKTLEAYNKSLEVLIQTGIDEAVDLIESKAGFYHHVNEAEGTVKLVQWSMGTKKVCKVPQLVADYKINEAGIWVECIKSKKPVVHNDYKLLKRKGKLPEGHFPVERDLEIPIMNGSDEVVAILGVGNKLTEYNDRDIEILSSFAQQFHALVEKKQLEQEHEQTLLNFSESQKVGSIGAWHHDIVYGKDWWSDVMFDIYGIPKSDGVPGEEWMSYIHPDDRERLLEAFTESIKTGSYECSYRLIRKDGEMRYVYAKSRVQYGDDGSPLRHIGLLLDITDQKKAELKIVEQNEQLETIIRSLNGVTFRINDQGIVEYISPQVKEILGYEVSELEGTHIDTGKVGELFHPDDKRREMDFVESMMLYGGDSHSEYRMLTKAGEVLWVDSNSVCIEGSNGRRYVQGYSVDITDKIRNEERIMNAIMNASDGEKQRISKEIHDGLQQTLTIAALNLEFIKKEKSKLSKLIQDKFELGWEYLKKGMEDTRSIAHRLMPKAIEDFGLVAVLSDMVDQMSVSTGIEFEFITNMEDMRIQIGAETNLYKLVQEAINNIIKHSKSNYVTIQYMKFGDQIQLIIEDDGQGFNPNKLNKNTGFGLASMKSRATALGATIEIDSQPGHGTTLIVDIPYNNELKYYE